MPMLKQQLDLSHQQRQAEADRNHQQYAEIAGTLAGDKTGKYVGQDGTLTPEGQKLQAQAEAAKQAWVKAAGVNKEAKSVIGKLTQLTDKLIHHRAGGQPPQSGQGEGQPSSSGMPQPPQAAASAGQSGAPTGSGMPPPPNDGVMSSPEYTHAKYQQSQADAAEAQKLDLYKKEGQSDADIKNAAPGAPEQMAKSLGNIKGADGKPMFSPEEVKKIVEEKTAGAAGRPHMHPVTVPDPNDPTGVRQIPAMQEMTPPYNVFAPGSDEPIASPGKLLPGMLPTVTTSSSKYDADQGITTTSRTTQKVVPKAKNGLPAPPASKASGGGSSTAKPSGSGGRVAAMADDWEQDGVVPSAKDKPAVEKFMKDNGKFPPVSLIPAAQSTIVSAAPVMDQISGLLKDIDDLKLGDNNKSGYLLASRAAYALGHASPEGSLGKDIAGLSLGSVVEAASTLKGASRSVLALKKALEHTPNPWVDSPKLMKEKLETIKSRLKDVMDDAYKYGKKGAAANYTPNMPKPPQTADEEAAAYLAKHAAAH
jgi:hypothetical protein